MTIRQSIRTYTTLKAGGEAEFFEHVSDLSKLIKVAKNAQRNGLDVTPVGWGSNILPSDKGVSGLVIANATSGIEFKSDGTVLADSGVAFQNLFLFCAQRGLGGLEYAVGIPGSLGGSMVSNAGAYRSCISEFLTRIQIVKDGEEQWVDPSWMQFSYRDSILRKPGGAKAVITQVEMKLQSRNQKDIYDEAREYQRQRIGKQPPSASAGSFFKNVISPELAQSIDGLTEGMRKNNVVPAGFLIERCGLRGHRHGGAMVGERHANFLLNVNGATATEIRQLASLVKQRVNEKYGVELEEEVLYLGDWSDYQPLS
ncbi:MAG TPA: UDP-N-acetylmuramate dehydrogenase [Fimbriimonas sp.]|nr:UDP-N-acetylmuramate dehydrogenase [Fimbriimonas sp.]